MMCWHLAGRAFNAYPDRVLLARAPQCIALLNGFLYPDLDLIRPGSTPMAFRRLQTVALPGARLVQQSTAI